MTEATQRAGLQSQVAEQLREVATSLNADHLMLLLQLGNMNKQPTQYDMKLFAEKVIPQLRGMFPELEDRWWPQPIDAADRAELPAFSRRRAAE